MLEDILSNDRHKAWVAVRVPGQEGEPDRWQWHQAPVLVLSSSPKDIDAALLELPRALPAQPVAPFADPPFVCVGPVASFGFPAFDNPGATFKLRPLPAPNMAGRVSIAGGQTRHLHLFLDATHKPEDVSRDWLEQNWGPYLRGFSGAPVVNPQNGRVIGLITHTEWSARVQVEQLAVAALATDDLRQRFPGLWDVVARSLAAAGHRDAAPPSSGAAPSGTLVHELAEVTIRRADAVLGARIGESPLLRGSVVPRGAVSQQVAVQRLADFADSPRREDQIRLVVGYRGTGKTTVFWALARRLAQARLETGTSSIPVLMNLRQIALNTDERQRLSIDPSPETLWHLLLQAWLRYADAARFQVLSDERHLTALDLDAVRTLLATERLVFLLDGADDFMTREQIPNPHLHAMIQHVLTEGQVAALPRRRFIIAVHDRWLGYEEFVSDASQILRLGQMGVEQVRAFLGPTLFERLRRSYGVVAADFPLRTPFELAPLRILRDVPESVAAQNRAGLLEHAVSAALPSISPHLPRGLADRSSALDGLTAIGTAAYRIRFSGERAESFPLDILQRELRHLNATWPTEGHPSNKRLLTALRVLADQPDAAGKLLSLEGQRMFTLLPNGQWSFTHGLWLEFTVGRFLAYAIADNHLDPIRETTFYGPIFEVAAQILQLLEPGILTRRTVERVLDAISEAKRTDPERLRREEFCIGNLFIVYGVERTPIESAALRLLGSRFTELPALARHVILGLLASRLVRNAPGDPSLADMKDAVISICRVLLRDPNTNAITHSLAWMVLAAVGGRGSLDGARWRALGPDNIGDALALARPEEPTTKPGARRLATLEAGYVESISGLPQAPHRVLSSVHYLFLSVCIHMTSRGLWPLMPGKLQDLFGGPRSENDTIVPKVRRIVLSFARHSGLSHPRKVMEAAEAIYAGRT